MLLSCTARTNELQTNAHHSILQLRHVRKNSAAGAASFKDLKNTELTKNSAAACFAAQADTHHKYTDNLLLTDLAMFVS